MSRFKMKTKGGIFFDVDEYLFRDKEGNPFLLKELPDNDLDETIKLVEIKANEGIELYDYSLASKEEVPKVHHRLEGDEALSFLQHHIYIAERNRRNRKDVNKD